MSKYRLKDAELQRHLDAISGGKFTATLESGSLEFDEGDMAVVTFGSSMHGTTIIAGKFSVILHKNETYVLAEYNPNDWNKFPDVTPPEGVLMRCVIKKPGRNLDSPEPELPKICARTSGVWDGKRWQFFGHGSLCEGSTVEYRPWE